MNSFMKWSLQKKEADSSKKHRRKQIKRKFRKKTLEIANIKLIKNRIVLKSSCCSKLTLVFKKVDKKR